MVTLSERLGLRGNPFEHYTAETEPHIADYAIQPPYLRSILERAKSCSSFILFGDRGAGKSATRITIYNQIWGEKGKNGDGHRLPLVANLTDFTGVQDSLKKDRLSDLDLVSLVAYGVVEQVLIWLASLEEVDRTTFIEGLDKEEKTLAIAFIRGFYLKVPDVDRQISTDQALRLLNSAWPTKSSVWISQRWDALGKIIAAVASSFSRQIVEEGVDLTAGAQELLKSLQGETASAPRAILLKLVEFVRIFPFSGIVILVDKVDETPLTSNSAEATTRLVYPVLSHIQLLEIPGFSWIMFLWSKVKEHFDSEKYAIRLDKLAHANITWDIDSLRSMVEARIRFYSEEALSFQDLFESDVNVDEQFKALAAIAINSPREFIKLMDTVVREHDARGADAPNKLDELSLSIGMDKYVVQTIGGSYEEKILQQVYRLGRVSFVNKDVQSVFKIGDQSARVKIRTWEDNGLVAQSGTVAPPSELGGQPAYRFVLTDPRVKRIIERKLVATVGEEVPSSEATDSETDQQGPRAG
jgi:hypothetical protein